MKNSSSIILKTWVLMIFTFTLFTAPNAIASENDVVVIKFLTDPVSVYATADGDDYIDKRKKSLPDPKKIKIIVERVEPTGMLKLVYEGGEMPGHEKIVNIGWVHESELKLK